MLSPPINLVVCSLFAHAQYIQHTLRKLPGLSSKWVRQITDTKSPPGPGIEGTGDAMLAAKALGHSHATCRSGLALKLIIFITSDSGSYTMNMIFALSIYYANNGICNMPQCLLFLGPLNATFWDVSKYQKNQKRP